MTVAVYKRAKDAVDAVETDLHRYMWEGLSLAMKVVNEAEVEAHKLAGWVMHPHETIEVPADPAPPAADVAAGANPFKKA